MSHEHRITPAVRYVCFGVSHHTTPVQYRELLYRTPIQVRDRLTQQALAHGGLDSTLSELVVLSTCNRMELYVTVSGDATNVRAQLSHLIEHLFGDEIKGLEECFFCHEGEDAAKHLAMVATGLDSQVLGESQILGQVSNAFSQAQESKMAGAYLSALFRMAIRAGKRARTETDISKNPASISSVALALAEKAGKRRLQEQNVLLVGAGTMGRLTMKALHARGIKRIAVANRSPERAALLVGDRTYPVFDLEQLGEALAGADVIVSATGAEQSIIGLEDVRMAQQSRAGKSQIYIDIAVPRDVVQDVRSLPGVELFDIDDLQGTLDSAQALRQREVPKVSAIVDEELDLLAGDLQELAVKPLIIELRRKAETIREQTLARSLRHIGDLDPDTLQHVQHFSRALVNQLLHDPTVRLKQEASNGHAAEYASIFRDLFALAEHEENLSDVGHET